MATAPAPRMSARDAGVDVLRKHGAPMHVKDITASVLSDYETGLKGKTPVATLGAQLHTAAKKGVLVRKVDKGTFALLEGDGVVAAPDAEPGSPAVTPNTVVLRNGTDVNPDPKPEKDTKTSRRSGRSS